MSADPAQLVKERVTQLLDEHDPRATDDVAFRGAQFDLGLAWVHFPEGWGGLGIAPDGAVHVVFGNHAHRLGTDLRAPGFPARLE